MKFKTIHAYLLAIISPLAFADYRGEVSLQHLQLNYDSDYTYSGQDVGKGSMDSSTNGFGLVIYTQQVSTQNVPLSQAGFLSRTTSITLLHSMDDRKTKYKFFAPYSSSGTYKEDEKNTQITARFASRQSPLIVSLNFQKGKTDGEDYDTDTDAINIGFGAYITDTTSLEFQYQNTNYDFQDTKAKSKTTTLTFQNVTRLANGNHAYINLGYSKEKFDDDETDTKTLSAEFLYYPTLRFGYGVSVAKLDVGGDINVASLIIEAFATENVGFHFEYFVGSGDQSDSGLNADSDIDGFDTEVSLRF